MCLHCGKPQEVGRKAMSITCKFCHKSLRLEDLQIKDYQARRGGAARAEDLTGRDLRTLRDPEELARAHALALLARLT